MVPRNPIRAASVAAQAVSGPSPSKREQSHEQSTERAVVAIERYCTEVQTRNKQKEPDFVLGTIGSTEEDQGQWRKYASKAEFEKAAEVEVPDDSAYVWMRDEKIIAANFTFQTGSGDWANYVDYCFRNDETTAEITSELRTFYGRLIVNRKWLFDSGGRILKTTEEFLDLTTKEPKKPGDDFIDEKTPLYLKVADLPFVAVLKKR